MEILNATIFSSYRGAPRNNWRRRPLACAVALLSGATLWLANPSLLYAAPAANALPRPGATWLRAGAATNMVNGNTLTVNQTSQKAILQWDSFNIGKDGRVLFQQPSANAVALNRIGGSSPSEIFGQLGANGSIYLINNNGVIFGGGAQVNVHGLLVSTMNVDDNLFMNSTLTRALDDGSAALAGGSAANAMIRVEGGARITTDSGGQVLMFAPQISNAGEITTPDGQALLAASKDKVYLAASDQDASVRGLLVEVGTGGSVENVGRIVAERGNITLLGLAVNQNGYLRATTSVDVNGSIRLLARDQATTESVDQIKSEAVVSFNDRDAVKPSGYTTLAVANRTGTVTFGANSVTTVEADDGADAAKLAPGAQPQARSRVDVEGKLIDMQDGSRIIAKGGVINMVATSDPKDPGFVSPAAPDDSRIHLGKNTLLDVSGYDVIKPMSSRAIDVELRANELQDAPLQRNGVLYGKTVRVDLEKGSPLISAQAWQAIKDGVKKDVRERLSAGGAIDLKSRGDTVFSSGATLDLRGGTVTYVGAPISTTRLLSGRQIINISDADPRRHYDGVYGLFVDKDPKWGTFTYGWNSLFYRGIYQQGFDEGSDAGALTVNSQKLYGLDLAVLKANATHGERQRAAADAPRDGRVDIALGQNNPFAAQQDVWFNAGQRSADIAADAALADAPLYISTDALNAAGVGSFSLSANGNITYAADASLTLSPGRSVTDARGACTAACDSLALTGTALHFDGKIYAPGGSITLQTTAPQAGDSLGNFIMTLGAGSVLDVSGLWINDRLDGVATTPLRLAGGSISAAAAGDLLIAAGAQLRADGGAQLTSAGKLVGGDGGSISLATRARQTGDVGSRLELGGSMSAYGFGRGGTLSLEANAVQIGRAAPGGAAPGGNTLWLDPALFESGGFASFVISANLHGVEVAPETVVNLRQSNRVIDKLSVVQRQATGADLRNFSSIVQLPDWQRKAVDLRLNAANTVGTLVQPVGDIRISQGARILGDPGATLTLNSERSIYIDGLLSAPGGSILAHITAAGGAQDPGYIASQAIWLGTNAQLLARATQAQQPTPRGQLFGPVWDAGSVELDADRGSVIAAPGSLLDVSGMSVKRSLLNKPSLLPGYASANVNAAAGALRFSAAESMAVYSELRGFAAGDGLAGSLSFVLDANQRGELNGTDRFPNQYGARELDIGNALPDWNLVAGFGQALPSSWKGIGFVSAAQIQNGGFSRLTLGAANKLNANGNATAAAGRIRFTDDVTLAFSDSVLFDTTNIDLNQHAVTVRAGSVGLGASDGKTLLQQTENAAAGSGRLNVEAQFIELLGSLGINHAGLVSLNSGGDIRLRSQFEPGSGVLLPATFSSAGDVTLAAAQIYPTTLSDYLFNLTGADSVFRTAAQGKRTAILSAGGSVRVHAPVIEHGGVLAAPLGTVELSGGRRVHLAANSVIDVSANGQLIPFGRLQGGDISWIYPLSDDQRLVISQSPEKQVLLSGPSVAMDSGASINLSGGGDIYGIEPVPGPGGSADFLAPEFAQGAFAVIPQLGSAISPYDQVEMQNTGIAIGTTIYLDGANGLPAGNYAVLPAHYALLPGAYLITPTGNSVAPGQRSALADGTPLVSGRFGRAFTDQYASQWLSFAVESGAVARTRTEYRDAKGDDYFGDKGVNLARDAGRVSISAQQQLELNGDINAATHNGRGAQMDIYADLLEVVAAGGVDANSSGAVQLDAGALSRLGIDSLLLGGVRSRDGDATAIDVKSGSVSLRGGAVLSVPDLILAARDKVVVESNAEINASGQSRQSDSLLKINAVAGSGSGALLRVSTAAQTDVARAGDVNGAGGELIVDAGARLRNASSVLLDATGDMQFAGNVALPNGSLNVSANRISLGDDIGAVGGLVFSNAQLAQLQAAELRLSSRDAIDFYGAVRFNNQRTELNAGALRAMAPGDVRIDAADTLQLSNTTGAAASGGGSGGALVLAARTLELGSARDHGGTLALAGFDRVQLGAAAITETVRGQGSFNLQSGAHVDVFADHIVGAAGANTGLGSESAVVLARANAPASTSTSAAAVPMGAKLSVSGASVELATAVELAGGVVTMTATGSSTDDGVRLRTGALIDVGGRDVVFPNSVTRVTGGAVNLRAQNGDVAAENGALVRIGGSGDAGALAVSAGGVIDWRAAIDAKGGAGYKGGSLQLDAGRLTDIDGWLSRIAGAGIDQRVSLRSRSGDLLLAQNLRAAQLDISADSGDLRVASILDASGGDGGSISLNAGGDLQLADTALLRADATTVDGRGGRVALGSSGGTLRFDNGSRISVNAGADNAGSAGLVKLRAPRNATDTDVAVVDSGVTISGARRVDLEGFAVYNGTVVDAALLNQALASANAFMGNAQAIEARLNNLAAQGLLLRPGIEIDSTGNLSVNTTLDFTQPQWRFGARQAPGVLTLRAADNLQINQSLLDGFVQDSSDLSVFVDPFSTLLTGASWDYVLTAGADLGAAARSSVRNGSGDLVIAAGADIITGDGDIGLHAGRDVRQSGTQPSLIASLGAIDQRWYDNVLTGGLSLLPDSGSFNNVWAFLVTLHQMFYPERGGNVSISAGNDVTFAASGNFFSDWLQRLGGQYSAVPDVALPPLNFTTWGVLLEGLQDRQGIAVLGGGNLDVRAGGNVTNLNATLPVTGKQTGSGGVDQLTWIGGGDASVRAGGSILSPRLLVDQGNLLLEAGGDIKAASGGLNTVLALADTRATLRARGDIAIDAVFNSTMMPQSDNQMLGGTDLVENYFFTYTPQAALNVSSLNGSVSLLNNTTKVAAALGSRFAGTHGDALSFAVYPGQLRIDTPQGDILLPQSGVAQLNRMALFPSADSQLVMNAGGSIRGSASASLHMADIDPQALASPQLEGGFVRRLFNITGMGPLHAPTPVHATDTQPAIINTLHGDIASDVVTFPFTFNIAKPVRVSAGRDLDSVSFYIQHNRDTDTSELAAGRDLGFPLVVGTDGKLNVYGQQIINVAGPGRLDVVAGRNIDLGGSEGVISVGNRDNGALPDSGADITLLAGINGATALTDPELYNLFADRYLGVGTDLGGSFIDWFARTDFQKTYKDFAVDQLVSAFTGNAYGNQAQALAAFAALPPLTRQAISLEAYRQTHAGGKDYAAQLVNFVSFERFGGDLASVMNALAPASAPFAGNAEAAAALALLPAAQQQQIALRAFNTLPMLARRELLLTVLFDEVRAGGVENSKGITGAGTGFERGNNAIAALFPQAEGEEKTWRGDLSLVLSAVRTVGDGDINILVPGGDVNVGLAGNIKGLNKTAGTLGIISQRYGAINGIAEGSFNVNQSRIFSLDGGDLLLWSSEGNIDAGRGAKTALTIPPPSIKQDPVTGNLTLEFPPEVAGSGMQTANNSRRRATERGALAAGVASSSDTYRSRQRFFRSLKAGDTYLLAPHGVVNAGDAGIVSGGDLLIAAPRVLGADNISAGGAAVGVPGNSGVSAGTLSLGNSASAVAGNAAQSMNEAMKDVAAASDGIAFVTVDIIGLGQ